jgi:hypothetical protein
MAVQSIWAEGALSFPGCSSQCPAPIAIAESSARSGPVLAVAPVMPKGMSTNAAIAINLSKAAAMCSP